jgi:hypothetical protein
MRTQMLHALHVERMLARSACRLFTAFLHRAVSHTTMLLF